MSVKIRLQRHGKKKQPIYHIVVADSHSPRDGRYIEKIGLYNPKNSHEELVLDSEKALQWLDKGALPSDTCRSLLSDKGVMYKSHLMKGVKKGLFTAEEAETKFSKWLTDKQKEDSEKKEKKLTAQKEHYSKRYEHEKAQREAKANVIAAKKAAALEAANPETLVPADVPGNEPAAAQETKISETPATESSTEQE